MPAMRTKDWKTLWRILSYIEMAAPLPMQRPSRMDVRKVMRV